MLDVLKRARIYANLTPAERALLRFGETLLVGAVLAGLQAILPVFAGSSLSAIKWDGVLHTFLAAFLMALYLGIAKYLKSYGDPLLPDALDEPSGPTGA